MSRTKWVDFKQLKSQLKLLDVLKLHGIELKIKGDQATGFCPLPTHKREGNTPPFSANLTKGIWQCFGCGAKGNVLDFAVRMDGLSPEKPYDVRVTALKLQERFAIKSERVPPERNGKRGKVLPYQQPATDGQLPLVINQPLDFELKGLDPNHSYLRGRGFTPETIKRFGLGYCSRGYFKDRIAIPIENVQGRLIAYAGRVVDDTKITDENPKYKFPAKRERNGIVHEFQKSVVLYNANRIVEPAPDLIIVEGFTSVWWLYQHGFKDVGALMGWSCSPAQAQIILSKVPEDGQVLVFPDGDDAGKRCAMSVFEQVGPHRPVQWVKLSDGRQPTDCQGDELFRLLSDV